MTNAYSNPGVFHSRTFPGQSWQHQFLHGLRHETLDLFFHLLAEFVEEMFYQQRNVFLSFSQGGQRIGIT